MRKHMLRVFLALSALILSCIIISLSGCAKASVQPEMVLQLGHAAEVSSIRFSPDGHAMATSSYDGTVKLWNTQSGELKRTMPWQDSLLKSVDFSPDGRILASAGDVVELREVETGKLLRALKHDGTSSTIAFSRHDGLLAIGRSDGTVALWDVGQNKYLKTFAVKNAAVQSVAFSHDGSTVAAGCWFPANYFGQVRLWDVKTGRALPSLGSGSDAEGIEIQFSPDKKTLAVTSTGADVMLWNWQTARLSRTLSWDSGGKLNHIAFSPDGKMLVTGGFDNAVRLWNTATGKKTHAITKVDGIIESLAFSPDGKSLLCGTSEGAVKVWETKTWKARQGSESSNNIEIQSAQFSPDGKTLAVGFAQRRGEEYFGGTQVWDATSGQLKSFLSRRNLSVESVALSPDGKTLASGEWRGGEFKGDISIWDLPTGKLRKTVTGHKDMVTSLSFLQNQSLVSISRDGNEIRIGDITTGKSKVLSNGENYGFGMLAPLAASPNGKLLAVVGYEDAQILDARTGELQRKIKVSPSLLRSVAFSSNNRWLAVSTISFVGKDVVCKVQLWDAATGKLIRDFPLTGENVMPHSLSFSADSKFLIGGGDQLRVWEVATGKLLHSRALKMTAQNLTVVALSSDGKVLSTGGSNGGVEIHNLQGRLLATFLFMPDIKSLAWLVFTPEGYYDASPEAEKYIRWRVGGELLPAADFKEQFHRPELVKKALSEEN